MAGFASANIHHVAVNIALRTDISLGCRLEALARAFLAEHCGENEIEPLGVRLSLRTFRLSARQWPLIPPDGGSSACADVGQRWLLLSAAAQSA
jgi:hypothetical protein